MSKQFFMKQKECLRFFKNFKSDDILIYIVKFINIVYYKLILG